MALVGHPPGDCISRVQHDDVVPAHEAANGRASAPFLQAIDWAIKPDRRHRPQTLEAWLVTFEDAGASLQKTRLQPTPVVTEEITRVTADQAVQSRRKSVVIGIAAALLRCWSQSQCISAPTNLMLRSFSYWPLLAKKTCKRIHQTPMTMHARN